MSNGEVGPWYEEHAKNEAFFKFLRYLAAHEDEAKKCLGDEAEARALFKKATKIDVPAGEHVIVLRSVAKERKHKGPVIVAIPPAKKKNATPNDLQQYVTGPYIPWVKPPDQPATN
jgi:hypothetical protein